MNDNNLKIGVLFGGSSSEKEVSLEGGRNVFQQLDSTKYKKIPIFVSSDYKFWQIPETLIVQNTCKDLEELLDSKATRIKYEELKDLIDIAFIVGHGKYMEDGALQGLMELLKIPYNGPGVLGSALGSNKFVQREILKESGVNIPNFIHLSKTEWKTDRKNVLKSIEDQVGFPCVSKPTKEGCSTAITVAQTQDEIIQGINAALAYDNEVLVEELLDGKEVTVSVLGNEEKQVLPITETPRGNSAINYLTLEDKFLPGGAEMITPADLTETLTKKVQETALKVCQALNLIGYPRIDMFITKDEKVVVLEPNSLPGITPSTMIFHQAAEIGLTPSKYLDKIIELAIEAHKNKKGPL